jgi:hypothetical protein
VFCVPVCLLVLRSAQVVVHLEVLVVLELVLKLVVQLNVWVVPLTPTIPSSTLQQQPIHQQVAHLKAMVHLNVVANLKFVVVAKVVPASNTQQQTTHKVVVQLKVP